MLHINIHGTVGKLSSLKSMIKESANNDPDVILLCETFLTKFNAKSMPLLAVTPIPSRDVKVLKIFK